MLSWHWSMLIQSYLIRWISGTPFMMGGVKGKNQRHAGFRGFCPLIPNHKFFYFWGTSCLKVWCPCWVHLTLKHSRPTLSHRFIFWQNNTSHRSLVDYFVCIVYLPLSIWLIFVQVYWRSLLSETEFFEKWPKIQLCAWLNTMLDTL